MSIAFHVFETALGWSGVAWSEAGIVAAQLWDRDADAVRRSMLKRMPDAIEQAPPGRCPGRRSGRRRAVRR